MSTATTETVNNEVEQNTAAADKKAAEKAAEKARKQQEREEEKARKKAEKEAEKARKEEERRLKAEEREALKAAKLAERQANKQPQQNGVTRPKPGGKTASIWDALDSLQSRLGRIPAVKDLMEEVPVETNINTIRTQYAHWRKYHGITGRVTRPGEDAA